MKSLFIERKEILEFRLEKDKAVVEAEILIDRKNLGYFTVYIYKNKPNKLLDFYYTNVPITLMSKLKIESSKVLGKN